MTVEHPSSPGGPMTAMALPVFLVTGALQKSRVRGSVTNNNGLWIGWLDLLALLLQLLLIAIAYNGSQSMAV
jgi:hypothetical protein